MPMILQVTSIDESLMGIDPQATTRYSFEPEHDINAYELALCMKLIFGTGSPRGPGHIDKRDFEAESLAVRRHFRKV